MILFDHHATTARTMDQIQRAAVKYANVQCRFVYLIGRKGDGALFFFVGNEPPDSSDYSPPGQVYDEASESFRHVFATSTETVESPYTDRWGIWVSHPFRSLTPPSAL